MNIKRIEELANDEDLTKAWFCSYLRDWDIEDKECGCKLWNNLTDKEKETLVEKAIYYWTKDETDAPIWAICDCVMSWQKQILNGKMGKWEFLNKLQDFID